MRPVGSVALVGNGPLTEAQRQRIAAADLVIRLNKMNNRHALRSRTGREPVLTAPCLAWIKHASAICVYTASPPDLGQSAGGQHSCEPTGFSLRVMP
jgi:hypothetical protein